MTGEVLTALTRETQALSAVLHELEPENFVRITNCPPWNLQELVVHIGDSIRFDTRFPSAEPRDELRSAADYYRRPERATSSYRQDNVDHTMRLARSVVTDSSAVQWLDEIGHGAIAALSDEDLEQAVSIPGVGPMILADWVTTRVVSVAAHGVDVAITLDRRPWTMPLALQVVRPVFVELLGRQVPAELDWDDQTLLVVAGGRRALTEHETELLGPHARRFPLFS